MSEQRPRLADDYAPAPFFVLRAPLLSVDAFYGWGEGLSVPNASDDDLERATRQDRDLLRERLRSLLERSDVREAIFVASPGLEASVDAWVADPDSARGRRTERGLVRYFTRMSTRPTPFGLFAGCAMGSVGDRTALRVDGPPVRSTRLDMGYLDLLMRSLATGWGPSDAPRLRANPTCYRAGEVVRYIETRVDGYGRSHHLVAVRASPAVLAGIEAAGEGASPDRVTEALRGIVGNDAPSLLGRLVEEQLLLPEPWPALTGPAPLEATIRALEGWPSGADPVETLRDVATRLRKLDETGPGADVSGYAQVASSLEKLPAPVDPSLLFQVDLLKGAGDLSLGPVLVAELQRAVDLLRVLVPGGEPRELSEWRDAFERRFEQREVPLLQALDEESGVPFGAPPADPSPLLRGLPFPEQEAEFVRWGARDRLLLRRLTQALEAGDEEIVLGAEDLEELSEIPPAPLATSIAIVATVAAASAEEIDRGRFRVLVRVIHGPPGTRTLGRWCHADEQLLEAVREHAKAEEGLDPGSVFAEVVHLANAREGNVLSRPLLRGYEIPVLGASGAAPERQIPLADLRISSRGRELVLRSERLDRRVVPRLTTAHNLGRRGVGAYRFLCLLAAQGVTDGLIWSPGALDAAARIPRIRSGKVVISPARWRVEGREAAWLRSVPDGELMRALRDWRARRRIPRLVNLVEGDRVLAADLDNILSAESVVAALPASGGMLEERFPAEEELPVRGSEGPLASELILPLIARDPMRNGSMPSGVAPSTERRSFLPGSDWLTLKVYGGTATLDRILLDVLAPRAEDLVASGAARRWFFLRYADPAWHIRLRLAGDPESLAAALADLSLELEPLANEGLVSRVETSTYEREVERYGGPAGVEVAEELFEVDSSTTARLLRLLEPGDAGADERWRMALAGAHRWFVDLGIGLEEEVALLRDLVSSYSQELGSDTQLRSAIGDRLRRERSRLRPLVEDAVEDGHPLALGFAELADRSLRARPALDRLDRLVSDGSLGIGRASFARSVVHMHLIRMLRSAPRRAELVLYTFLGRLLREKLERR